MEDREGKHEVVKVAGDLGCQRDIKTLTAHNTTGYIINNVNMTTSILLKFSGRKIVKCTQGHWNMLKKYVVKIQYWVEDSHLVLRRLEDGRYGLF